MTMTKQDLLDEKLMFDAWTDQASINKTEENQNGRNTKSK